MIVVIAMTGGFFSAEIKVDSCDIGEFKGSSVIINARWTTTSVKRIEKPNSSNAPSAT